MLYIHNKNKSLFIYFKMYSICQNNESDSFIDVFLKQIWLCLINYLDFP